MRLMVETDLETGCRWGELIELRVRDLDRITRFLTISRVAVELTKQFQVDGQRFVVKKYPKDKEHRRLRLSKQIVTKIDAHIKTNNLKPDDLLFAIRDPESLTKPKPRALPDPDDLGLTEPNKTGRRYRHGTRTAYNMAKCHCQHCRDAYAIYRSQRRANLGHAVAAVRMMDRE